MTACWRGRPGPETQPNTEQELDPPLKSRFQLLMVTMQKTLLLNVIRRRSRPSKGTVCVIHLRQTVCTSRDLRQPFTSVHPATYLHLSVDHHRGGRGSVHLTAQCFLFTPSPGVLVVFRAALCNICVEYQQLLSTLQHKAPGSDRTENLIHTNRDLHICL